MYSYTVCSTISTLIEIHRYIIIIHDATRFSSFMNQEPPGSFPHDSSLRSSVLAELPSLVGTDIRLAVLSDMHVTRDERGSWRLYHHTIERLRTALSSASEHNIDGIIITGDLTRNGGASEFSAVSAQLRTASVPTVCVPGNHDLPEMDKSRKQKAISTFVDEYVGKSFPFSRRFGDVEVVGLNSMDTADHDVASGAISQNQLDRLDATLSSVETPIVITHHPLTESWSAETPFSPDQFRLTNAPEVIQLLYKHEVSLVLSGHVHWPLVSSTGRLHEIVSPAVCSYPQAYLLIDITPNGTTVSMEPLPNADIQLAAYRKLCDDQPLDGAYVKIAQSDYLPSLDRDL